MIYDVLVIGGGPAGMAAAIAARENGAQAVRILERDSALGGILNQCIHNGFGLHYFKEELTGPEYAERFMEALDGVEVSLDTMVLQITQNRQVHAVSPHRGYEILEAKAIVLAMGCRERTRGAIAIPGARPAGILTAGAAQHYVNMEGHMVGKRVVILGSGDIGLIMARRLTLEGAKVLACLEVLPYSGGLTRNIVQCLEDYDIPLYLSHTVTDIRGQRRVEQVVAAQVDEHRNPIPGTERVFDCDTLLLSVGLIPENELSREAGIPMDAHTGGAVVFEDMQTQIPGIFACGNAVHVHDLVDFVTMESRRAGAAAARFAVSGASDGPVLTLYPGENVRYTVPQCIRPSAVADDCTVLFRVGNPTGKAVIEVWSGSQKLLSAPRGRTAPGEMEQLKLPKSVLDAAKDTLRILVREVSPCAR